MRKERFPPNKKKMSFISDPIVRIDLILLFLFLVFFSGFLYTRKRNLKKDGLLFLYRTSWGIKIINYLGTKHKRTLKILSWISIICGYILMVGAIYFIYTIVKIYLFNPDIVRALKVPPILPLVPYLPQAFKLSFLPPFYFTYWILILAIIAITHEMAHGIFAAYNKVKIKTTGFGFFPWFLPIFLAAFVELDEKKMGKKPKFAQLSILSAGTFANIITAILFTLVLFGFFSLAFTPTGIVYDSYATTTISIAGITMINGIPLGTNHSYDKVIELSTNKSLNNLTYTNLTFLTTKDMLENQKENGGNILVYFNAPAIKENISSIITKINGVKIDSVEKLRDELANYKPGETVTITEKIGSEFIDKKVTLGQNPDIAGKAWLGIGFFESAPRGFFGNIISKLASFKNKNIYYEPKFEGLSIFIYNLLWWIILISLSVALMNMLPVGIFDGGRFFYLTVLGITKSEKIARRAFAFTTYLFLFIILLLMAYWVKGFF